jgi:hypothetical protein
VKKKKKEKSSGFRGRGYSPGEVLYPDTQRITEEKNELQPFLLSAEDDIV